MLREFQLRSLPIPTNCPTSVGQKQDILRYTKRQSSVQQLSGVISQEATVGWASPKWRRENRKAEYSTGESPQENHKEKYQDWSHRAEALKKKYSINRMPNTTNILRDLHFWQTIGEN